MMNFYKILVLFFLAGFSAPAFSQTLSGKLLDGETRAPLSYAHIQIGDDYGVISNSEGDFSIVISAFTETDSLYFSSLGYKKEAIAISDYKGQPIYLKPQAEKLGAVLIQTKELTAEEIMEKVNENLDKNYASVPTEFMVYRRNKSETTPKKIEIETKKAKNVLDRKTLKKFNQTIDSVTSVSRNNKSTTYASLLGQSAKTDSLKMRLEKASLLINREKNVNMENFSMEIYEKLASHIRSANTFHVRSGLFGVEDSLDLSKGFSKKKSDIDSVQTAEVKNKLSGLLSKAMFGDGKSSIQISTGGSSSTNIPQDFIKSMKDYDYQVEDIMMLGDDFVYQISFKPSRRKGKYSGQLYVSTADFGIYRMEFGLAEGKKGASINMKMLLGIKFVEKDQSGIVIYQKLGEVYQPQYIQLSGKHYGYINRSFTMTENIDHKKDRIKLKIGFEIEFDNAFQDEWMFSNIKPISTHDFANFKENKGIPEHQLTKFDAAFWEGNNTLAPTKAVRDYDGN